MSDPYGGKSLIHALTCPVAARYRRRRNYQPFWRQDKTAQMLGVAQFGCFRCGRGAIAERDADLRESKG